MRGSRSLLLGLRDQKRSELTEDVIVKLQRGFDAHGVPARVTDYLSSPSQALGQSEYNRWLLHWSERVILEPEGEVGEERTSPSSAKRRELESLVRRAKRILPGKIESFVQFASADRGHSPERIALATYSVFEPLLEVRTSGYVEVGAEELNDREFGRFVRNGLARARILLGRASDIQRLRGREARQIERERLGFTNSRNPLLRTSESHGLRRKRPNIGDAIGNILSGKEVNDYPVEIGKEDITRWIPRELWAKKGVASTPKRGARLSAREREKQRERIATEEKNAQLYSDAKAKRAHRSI